MVECCARPKRTRIFAVPLSACFCRHWNKKYRNSPTATQRSSNSKMPSYVHTDLTDCHGWSSVTRERNALCQREQTEQLQRDKAEFEDWRERAREEAQARTAPVLTHVTRQALSATPACTVETDRGGARETQKEESESGQVLL